MTCVYCEPKSRMRIFECADVAAVFTLRMSLRHAVFVRQIARFAFFGADLSLAGNTAFQLRLHFLTALLFERISAATGEHCTADHEQDRHAFHLHILRSKHRIAIPEYGLQTKVRLVKMFSGKSAICNPRSAMV